jgi:hypothetical protein
MKQAPNQFNATQLFRDGWPIHTEVVVNDVKVIVPARPLGLDTIPNRFKQAWAVFTGKADALYWTGQ